VLSPACLPCHATASLPACLLCLDAVDDFLPLTIASLSMKAGHAGTVPAHPLRRRAEKEATPTSPSIPQWTSLGPGTLLCTYCLPVPPTSSSTATTLQLLPHSLNLSFYAFYFLSPPISLTCLGRRKEEEGVLHAPRRAAAWEGVLYLALSPSPTTAAA